MGRAVDDPRFDDLIQFLEDERFKPEVTALEQRLSALAEELGVHRERLEIGSASPAVDLAGLREKLEGEGVLRPGQPWTVVGADSVHSAVRDLCAATWNPPTRPTNSWCGSG